MLRTIVVNLHDADVAQLIARLTAEGRGLIPVHRPSKWGNPFSHLLGTSARFRVVTRAEAVRQHALWLPTQPALMADLVSLRGNILGCFCVPRLCHATTLARLADELELG